MTLADLPARIQSKIEVVTESGCWIWMGWTNQGYGCVRIKGKIRRAHRVVYELLRGPIPPGLTLDHLCRVRNCANPDHLEPCTIKENIMRGEGLAAVNHRKIVCMNGHLLSGLNLFITVSGTRQCRCCRKEKQRTDVVRARKSLWKRRHHV